MIKDEILVYVRSDLHDFKKDKPIEDIDHTDFSSSLRPYQVHGFVIFIDDDGKTKVLKNRYGK